MVRYRIFFIAALFVVIGVGADQFGLYRSKNEKHLADLIQENVSSEIAYCQAQLDLLIEEYSTGTVLFDKARTQKYPTLIFEDDKLMFWSDFIFVPKYDTLSKLEAIDFIDTEHGSYVTIKAKIPYSEADIELYTLLPIQKRYPIDNNYLHSSFNEEIFPEGNYEISLGEKGKSNILYGEKSLFSFHRFGGEGWTPNYLKWLVFSSIAIAVLLLLYAATRFADNLVKSKRLLPGIAFISLVLVATRFFMIWGEIPRQKLNLRIFDPVNFTIDQVHATLGDLVLNQLFLLLIVLFVLHSLRYSMLFKRWLMSRKKWVWGLIVFVVTGLSLISARYIYQNIRDILINSQIELDISASIYFDSLRIFVLISFLLTSILFFGIQFFNIKLLIKLWSRSPFVMLFSVFIAFLVFYWIFPKNVVLFLVAITIFWGISSQLKFIFSLGRRRYSAFIYFFLTATVVSAFGAYAVYEQQLFDTEIEKKKFANNLLIERDILGEYLLSQALPTIQKDQFIISRMYSERLAQNTIEERINRSYLIDYFDKYHASVNVFNQQGNPFSFNEIQVSLDSLKKRLSNPNLQTDYSEIFYVNEDEAQDKYFAFIDINSLSRRLGTIVLELTLKNYVSNSVYPELLIENKYSGASNSKFDYAIYQNDDILYKVGNFNYARDFNPQNLDKGIFYRAGLVVDDHHHVGIRAQENRTIVITSKKYKGSNVLANFSFFFFVHIIGIGFILIGSNIFFVYPRAELNFATKISFYLGAAFLIPLFIVSVAILNSLNVSYREEISNSYEKTARRIEEFVNNDVAGYFSHRINKERLSTNLSSVTGLVQNDINVFDAKGMLIASSQSRIFTSDLISNYINPYAIYEIIENKKERTVLDESIGSLDYKTFYISIRSRENGKLLGILGMPFFESKNHLRRQQVEVFNNLINIFVLILIVSLIISYFAVRILTNPLAMLTAKIKKTSLTDLDQPLEYKANDEIGLLVTEYNQMLEKLKESKIALSRSEKESAWKEIAKQVAHEIKNPLTPMKLTLQQMQRVLGDDHKSSKPIKNLLVQVDTLSDIATSFSTFAQMPVPENSKFNVIEVLKHSIELFENQEGEINTGIDCDSYIVNGDAKLMGRIFNNLLINAMQSVPEERHPEIKVSTTCTPQKITISFSDNGAGIPEELHNKIFIPNFSTKEKGSGIGLAVAKRGIEHAGGDIWFETSENGTTFFINLVQTD